MTQARRRPLWAATLVALAVLATSVLAFAPAPGAATAAAASAPAAAVASAPAAASTTAPLARPVVSSNPVELAQTLVQARSNGTFRTNPNAIFDREIAPLAQGKPIAGCALDVRVLQVLVLTLANFGSVGVSDLQRPCIGSNLNCGPPTYSVHCLNPGEAIDFTSVGSSGLNGSNSATVQLLRYLDSFVPSGTNAGQANCRSPLALANIRQFSDSCNHQHVDFRNTDAPLNVTELLGSLPSIVDSSAYVTGLYRDFLGRTPSTDESSGWATQLSAGAPRTAVSDSFVNSDEYRLIRIDAAYRSILGRASEPAGRENWLTAMHMGAITTDDIETQLYASQEYYLAHSGSDRGFAASLYVQLLHRNASSADRDFWTGLVAQYGRPWVISQFWDASETISERVGLMYQKYLGRAPDAGGLASWVGVALDVGDSGLRSGLTSSDEYYNRAVTAYS